MNTTDSVARQSDAQARIDLLEENLLAQGNVIDLPLRHRFTPGMYCREIFMPAGALLTSKIHKTEHIFVILSGKAEVFTEEEGPVVLSAPHVGITKPGTRRVIRILEDCRWITFHPNPEDVQDLGDLEKRLIAPRESSVPGLPPVNERYRERLTAQEQPVIAGQYEYGGAP